MIMFLFKNLLWAKEFIRPWLHKPDVKDELEAIDYKKTMAKYQLDDINNQITYLNKISYNKRNEIAYLKIGAQELEGYVHGLENHN